MDSFYTQPGMKFLNVPLERLYLDYLHVLKKSRTVYASLTPEEGRKLKKYLTEDRPIRHCGPLNIFDRYFNFFTYRRVLKVHKATPLIEWLSNEFDFDIIYLIRHPIPQSISAKRHGFSNKIDAFLSDNIFVEKHLTSKQQGFLKKILKSGTDHEKYVAGWCLENLVCLKIPKDLRRWLTISYEELVTKPLKCFTFLSEQLQLEDIESMMNRIKTPSRGSFTSLKEKHKRIRTGDVDYLITGWFNEVHEAEAARAMNILELFGINAYRHDRFFPDDEFILFQ
jgi:hypothetical protein